MKNQMHRMKKLLLISMGWFSLTSASAQQLPLASQYIWNDYLLNPAIAGTKDYMPAIISYRSQWAGLKDAPVTQTGSIHGALTEKVGLGVAFINDKTGPSSNSMLQLGYSYKIKLTDKYKLSFGLAPMIMQYSLDKAALSTDQPNDIAIDRMSPKTLTADINCGVYFYAERYFAGISAPQVLANKIRVGDLYSTETLRRHYYANGGYRFTVKEKYSIEPSVLFKVAEGLPMQLDINVKAMYDQLVWVGTSYRTNNSIVGMLGITKYNFSFGYAYDYALSDIRKYNSGSHEFFLMYNIMKKKEEKVPQIN